MPERLAPLSGAIFVVMAVVAFAVLGGETPSPTDSLATVQAFYGDDYSNQTAAAIVIAFSSAFLMFFTAILGRSLREAGGTGRLAWATLGAGTLATAGFLVAAGIHLGLAEAAHNTATRDAVLTMNVLDGNNWPLMVGGMGLFAFSAGLSAVRHGGLPKAVGWLGVVAGAATFTPIGFFGFIATGAWTLIASIALAITSVNAPVEPLPPAGPRAEQLMTDESAMPRTRAPVS